MQQRLPIHLPIALERVRNELSVPPTTVYPFPDVSVQYIPPRTHPPGLMNKLTGIVSPVCGLLLKW